MVLTARRLLLMSAARATTLLPAVSVAAQVQQLSCGASYPPPPPGPFSFPLLEKRRQSPDSWLLRFGLPEGRRHLGSDPALPTCIQVYHNGTDEDTGLPKLLKKSYSPVSHPAEVGSFELLVKAYADRQGGGVGAGICATEPGESLVAKLKPERLFHGSPAISGRWDHIGLVAGGTGVAPLVQIIRIVLDDPADPTTVSLLSVNRREDDILMREELDRLAAEHPGRFRVTYTLTGEGGGEGQWDGRRGRGDAGMALEALPPPAGGDGSTMIFVCGTDGFVDTWAGPVGRAPPLADGSKGPKVQGALTGILRRAGYTESEVFKY